ncbi:Aminoacyl tRNA synthase complex-interacting multifunctional protein 1 [Mitosporidium daphniae]
MSEAVDPIQPSSSPSSPAPPPLIASSLSIQDLVSTSSHLDLRVGRMMSVEKHPSADKLYIEQVDFGSVLGIRTVVSGLVPYFTPDQIQGKLCLFVANLKPASMRGVKSQAMVLVARGPCGNVEFIAPPKSAQPGDRATFSIPGESGSLGSFPADPILNPKKLHWETVQPALGISPHSKSIVLKASDGSEAILLCGSDPVHVSILTTGVIS